VDILTALGTAKCDVVDRGIKVFMADGALALYRLSIVL
jgi:hypothetical protein